MAPDVPPLQAALPSTQTAGDAYAQALLDLAADPEAAEALAEELHALIKLLDEIDGFEQLLTGNVLRRRELVGLVHRVFEGRTSRTVLSFLAVLARRGRMGLLREIAGRLRARLDARRGKVEMVATTAVPLDAAQQEQVRRTIAGALAAEPVLTFAVDENLLGGLALRVGHRVYDASAAARLERLARQIARGAGGGEWADAPRAAAGTSPAPRGKEDA